MQDRDLPETAPMTMPWLADPGRAAALARQRAVKLARRASAARAAALTLVVPPPLPR